MKQQIWFVTGASKGIGLTLVRQLLDHGCRVAATSRNQSELEKAVGKQNTSFLPLGLEITDETAVAAAIRRTVDHFGGLDVIVNNAGYGLLGSIEELTDAETRENFNVNVFAALNVLRHGVPYLRRQGSGHVINIASIAGFTGNYPGFGIYCATKFAMHGFSEGLSAELQPFGVHVTVVSPGYFRTNFLEGSSLRTPARAMEEYTNVRESQRFHETEMNGSQAGDPEKAAAALIELTTLVQPPLHLFLGQDAYDGAYAKMESVKKDLDNMRELATSTGFVAKSSVA